MLKLAEFVRDIFCFAIVAASVVVALWLGLLAFEVVDDWFVNSLLLQGSIFGFLVSILWYTLQFDWAALLFLVGLSLIFGYLLGALLSRGIYAIDLTKIKASPRLVDATIAILLAAPVVQLCQTGISDEVDLSDLDEALAGFALLLLPVAMALAGWRWWPRARLGGFRPPDPPPPTLVRSHLLVGVILVMGQLGVPPNPFPTALPGTEWGEVRLEASGGRAAAQAVHAAERKISRLVDEIMTQGERAVGRLVADRGRPVGGAAVRAAKTLRSLATRAARAVGIRNNATEGLMRNELARAELQRRFPKAEILTEVMLRGRDGNVVRTSMGGRRLDLVAVENGRVVTRVEVTSPARDKFAQLTREELVRDAGGNFVRAPDGRLYDIRQGGDDVWRVDLTTGLVMSDAAPPMPSR